MVNPGFDPTSRRVFLDFEQVPPGETAPGEVPVGTRSIAVRKY
jgi:hypothetical protein